jgi:RNA-directed DNA polymerase
MGRVIEPRNQRIGREPTPSVTAEGHGRADNPRRDAAVLPPGSESSARPHMLSAREPGALGEASPPVVGGRQAREAEEAQAAAGCSEVSDEPMVPKKPANSRVMPEESVEGRGEADGKSVRGNAVGTQCPKDRAHVTERIGERAKQEEGVRFTNLLSHLTVPLLKKAYLGLRKDAASGVDGETWSSYGETLDVRLRDLAERIHRGSYHPQPVRRVHIPKGDGRTRPLGIPALEDKIAQQAARMVLEPIYENDAFLGFSYGFRPGRSPHQALDALGVVLHQRKVNWVLDADIRAFFDTIDHGWMQKFVEHRIADKRMVRLLMKWLHAGVMEDGELHEVEEGTPQGGLISPLLANIYLHYVLDLWAHSWRKRHARGEVYIVRYADDFVMGFQYERDARAMRTALAERLAEFGLELHADKTRVIRFGRFAERDSALDGRKRPETFDFLGFTHICGKSRPGRFLVFRRTSRKKRRAKLAALREEIRRRRHDPVAEQYKRLSQGLRGHFNYYGVPGNYRALASFRHEVRKTWHAALQRRSQRARWKADRRDRFDKCFPLPSPRITRRRPAQLTLPLTVGGSPVREIRTPGSVRGAG